MPAPPPSPFRTVSTGLDFPRDEAGTLAFWKQRRIFEQSLAARAGQTPFVFYEGPPTANGLPHNGHVLTRVMKDIFPRFRSMRGFDVPRKAGWDTHGLPVEVEVEKELRIHGKADIEAYGVEKFTARCIESVFRYTSEWEKLTEKIGFWVDTADAYVTYHRTYVESVWWALSQLFDKGLLYQGHKVVWWWAQGGTALSSAEVGLGYRQVDDPSAYVAFPLKDEPGTSLLVWTTTPWTLASNMYAAVKADVAYVTVDAGDRKLVLAEALREPLAAKLGLELPVVARCRGADLVGRRYEPPFDLYAKRLADERAALAAGGDVAAYFRVIAADFVTLDTGTGIVHIAPAFGEDDHVAHRKLLEGYAHPEAIELLCAIEPDGTFSAAFELCAGQWVKGADKAILADLTARGLLVFGESYRHDYPFCWRSDDDPLIQYARPAWYIRTTAEIGRAIADNQAVSWLPEHIRDGRFGEFLAHNVDWALSRERYWGTPLPIWINAKSGEQVAVASLEALRARPGCNLGEVERELAAFVASNGDGQDARVRAQNLEHLIIHKPWIDKVTFGSDDAGWFQRVPDVIDCWFDSGCMPFAQWGFPHAPGSSAKFDAAFPADFICEAIDQTRGWFYSLLMVSTLVFDDATLERLGLRARPLPHPYKTCIVLGHVCDREGKKESKSKGNYTPPEVILERVAMDFAVVREGGRAPTTQPGVALIAREDLEGLDLQEGAKVLLQRVDDASQTREVVLRAHKGWRRRLISLASEDADALGLRQGARGEDIMPVEVPKLPKDERVTVFDPSTPAPGADGFRWFFYAASPPWTNTRHSLSNVRALQKDFQVKLRNVYSFFVIYAQIDGFSPAAGNASASGPIGQALRASEGYRPAAERPLLDRWMLSELALATAEVTAQLEAYRPYEAAQRLVDLVDALSNWYVRRSRERFWAPGLGRDKQDAYFTLYEALVTLAQVSAPFIPFFAEELYRNLVCGPWPTTMPESVHLCDFPAPDRAAVDEPLAEEMRTVRELVSLGLSVRTQGRLKVRQPLRSADVVLARQDLRERLEPHAALVADELNVREVLWLRAGEEGSRVTYALKPNFRALGPKLGKKVQLAKTALAKADAAALRVELAETGKVVLDLDGERVELGPEEIAVTVEAGEGFAAAGSRVGVVVLHTELDDELRDAGLVREVLARVQAARKDAGLDFADRIRLALAGSERVERVVGAAREAIAREALAVELVVGASGFEPLTTRALEVDGESLTVSLARA